MRGAHQNSPIVNQKSCMARPTCSACHALETLCSLCNATHLVPPTRAPAPTRASLAETCAVALRGSELLP